MRQVRHSVRHSVRDSCDSHHAEADLHEVGTLEQCREALEQQRVVAQTTPRQTTRVAQSSPHTDHCLRRLAACTSFAACAASAACAPPGTRQTFFPAFKQCVDAGARSIMCAYNGVNGYPSCMSPLMAEVLRKEWGFDGYIVTDSGALKFMVMHSLTALAAMLYCAACHCSTGGSRTARSPHPRRTLTARSALHTQH